ncbi:NrtA/SsuA/CpmA family ABC transporter substrate-binding protein [Tsukamurella sp. M9C]|uniref:NrtA/SsuA/CpmA family ABC transporter substrate-binding protein n=1 Tax=unclassified Tsukamurella TaxID=2633480 RepID=UPI001CC9FDB3|nr:NrtA/SsuA/CpmA family ABC transporter substrate-binding protein [Tsukamurella sp. M9C]MCA0157135.1 NrtA/SsuA/CpmA family ABC transporter substrate-binding protein [Tsukamurella sp. M9C]
MTANRFRAGAIALGITALVAVGTTACGGSSQEPAAGDFVLKVTAPQNAGALAVGKRDHVFDDALKPLGARIEWVEAPPAFSANLKLFNAGQLDVSEGAYSPVVGALSKNVPVRIVAVAHNEDRSRSGIIVRPDSGIRSVADLPGKRVAVNAAAKGDYITLKALQQAKIPVDRVERVALQPSDATAAFSTGRVDAWASFNDPYEEARARGGVEIATEESIDSRDHTILAFRTAVLDARPDVAAAFLTALQGLKERQRTDPAAFQNVFDQAGPRAVTGDRLARAIASDRVVGVPRYPTAEDEADLQSVIDLFADNAVISRRVPASEVLYPLRSKAAEYSAAAGKGR